MTADPNKECPVEYEVERRLRACDQKAPLLEHVAKQRSRETGLAMYKCPYCAWWHLTSAGVAPERRQLVTEERKDRRSRRNRRHEW